MKNIIYVTGREYLTRVRKKSFVVMTLLGPLLLAAFYGAIIWLAVSDMGGSGTRTIRVVDYSGLFADGISGSESMSYVVDPGTDSVPETLTEIDEAFYGKLIIPKNFSLDQPEGARFISRESLSLMDQERLETHLESAIRRQKLQRAGLSGETLDSLQTKVDVASSKMNEAGELRDNNTMANAGAGFVGAILIYMFIFLYGVQVMKSVAEEKSNRIVEVIISSLKPFELMMGKILGIALVGLTQLVIWVGLSAVLISVVTAVVGSQAIDPETMQEVINRSSQGMPGVQKPQLLMALFQLDLVRILLSFSFYFITGYLLYSALFAAIASAVDSETDTQQFMLPVTIPLIFSLVIAESVVVKDPSGTLATWFSMIPFTSPVVMMVRIPFGVPDWQLFLSMIFMIFGFIITTWLAARIYRIGILMYGKKASWKELLKWVMYRD